MAAHLINMNSERVSLASWQHTHTVPFGAYSGVFPSVTRIQPHTGAYSYVPVQAASPVRHIRWPMHHGQIAIL